MLMLKDNQYFVRIFFLPSILYLLSSIFYCGCASLPVAKNEYLSLAALCKASGISLDYDTFTRKVVLSKDFHRVDLMLGQSLALVDGRPQDLKYPLLFRQGDIVVPHKFKDEVIDPVFKFVPNVSSQQASLIKSPIKKIVLDAGHGGHDPGAVGKTGLREKIVTLDIAKRLAKLLKDSGFEVAMTRSSDNFISLARRVEITNSARADLFISIHANANRVRNLRGFEVYYIAPGADDAQRAIKAAKGSRLNLDGAYFGSNSLELKAIVWNMIYTSCRAESVDLAQDLCRSVNNSLGLDILGIKGANFYVLKGAQIPALLIETGFLTNPNEEKKLRNSYYRQQIATAINDGVRYYAQKLALAEGGLK